MKTTAEAGKPLVLFSIRPKYCLMYTDGTKRVEIRKTRPKIELPFTGLIYCTKDYSLGELFLSGAEFCDEPIQGKVIGEFVCDHIFEMSISYSDPNVECASREFPFTGLTDKEIMDYLGNGGTGYGIHVSDLTIYDKPKELSEFRSYNVKARLDENGYPVPTHEMTRPPQSWCYVEKL